MGDQTPGRGRDHDPVERLNDHHADDLVAVARVFGGQPGTTTARAERIDDEGIVLAVETPGGPTTARVSFSDVPDGGRVSLRRRFLALARRARAELDRDGGDG